MGIYNLNTETASEIIKTGSSASIDMLGSILGNSASCAVNNANVRQLKEIDVSNLKPARCILLTFSGGVKGKCIAVYRDADLKIILSSLMSEEQSDDFDEMSLGMIKEILSQMAAEFAAKLGDFLGTSVELETSDVLVYDKTDSICDAFECQMADSALTCLVNYEVTAVLKGLYGMVFDEEFCACLDGGAVPSASASAPTPAPTPAPSAAPSRPTSSRPSTPTPAPSVAPSASAAPSQTPPPRPSRASRRQAQAQEKAAVDQAASVAIAQSKFPDFSADASEPISNVQLGNMDLLMDVPLNVTVEIGKTKRKMKEIMNFAQGTVIPIDKQAGAPVDIVVNGRLIARGDVVVIDDSFAVRITEIVNNREYPEAE